MNIQIKRAAEALYKCDRACLASLYAGGAAAVALPGEETFEVAAEHG